MCVQKLPGPGRSLLVFVLVITSVVSGMWSSHQMQARADNNINQVFVQAAADFSVPVSLLKALCYMEGRLGNRGGTPSIDGGYGCMHLMETSPDNSLTLAARDLRVDPTLLKTDLATNIRGGAAVLRDFWRQHVSSDASPTVLNDWYEALSIYSGASSLVIGHMYADAVYKIINQGFVATADDGERITLLAEHVVPPAAATPSGTKHRHIGAMGRVQPDRGTALPEGCVRDGNTDYPGAIDCILNPDKFDCNTVDDNAPCNYETSDRPPDYPVDFIGIHDVEGSALDAINYFHNVKGSVSSHYVVDTNGTVYQIVHDNDIAYHLGNYWYNQRAIGVEHAGYAATGYQWYNTAMYQSSARLVAYLLNKYHLPLDRSHVIGHGDVPSPSVALMPNHVDPGPYWLWGYYFNLISAQGIPLARNFSFNASVISINAPFDRLPVGRGGHETSDNYNFYSLYNGPSTNSGLIPHAGSSVTDETSNIGPGVSYAYTTLTPDQAGTGMMMYQIWYGVESHLKDKKPSRLCSARQVWLAVPTSAVSRGIGMQIVLGAATKVYGKPEQKNDYQIGDAPPGAIFVSAFGVQDDKNNYWYEINFNHRQAWIPEAAVNL